MNQQSPASQETIDDPVLAKRERIRSQVKLGKQVGYSLMTISIVLAILFFPLNWPALLITSMVTFTLSCIILPLPIIFGYGIKSAEKEDRKMGL